LRPQTGAEIQALTRASAENLVANLLELAYDAILVFSLPNSAISYWNSGAERIYGWKASEAIGRRPGELLHSEFDLPRADVEAEVISNGRWSGEIRQRRRDGSDVVVAAEWVLLHDASGEPSAVVEINRDVTTRLREAELNAAKTTLLDLASDAIFTLSVPEMAITYWSAGATRMYGWLPEEAIGKQPPDLLHTQHDRPREEIIEHVLRTGHWAGTIVQRRRDGSELIVDGRWALQVDESGVPRAVLEINRDMTAERAAEAAKTDFLNLVGHELRTPFAVINGYVSLLSDGTLGEPPAEWSEALNVIGGQLQGLGRLIESVVAVSSLGRGDLATPLQSVDLRAEVSAAIARSGARSRKQVPIEFDAAAGPVMARGNASLVGRIIDALIDNAVGHATSREPVRVWLTEDPMPSIHVLDHGPGIAPENRQVVFEMFGRVDNPRSFSRRGFGLGLFGSRRLARAMGGDVTLETSTLRKGSTFKLSLPPPA